MIPHRLASEERTDKEIFYHVWKDVWKNVFFMGTAAFVVVLVAAYLRWLGLLLFFGFTVLTIFQILHLILTTGVSLIFFPLNLLRVLTEGGTALRSQLYLSGAHLGVFLETLVLIAYNLLLYIMLFPKGLSG